MNTDMDLTTVLPDGNTIWTPWIPAENELRHAERHRARVRAALLAIRTAKVYR